MVYKGTDALTDSTKDWANGIHKNRLVKIVGAAAAGAGQMAVIADNSRNTLIIKGNWFRAIGAGAGYIILEKDLAQILRDVLGACIDIDLATEFDELKASLMAALEASIDSGIATGGSNTTIIDTGKSWAVNMWADATFEVTIAGIHYLGFVVSNTATTITFAALGGGAIVVAGSEYSLKRPVTLADISDRAARLLGVVQSLTQWGGTALTGRNISADLQALTDISITGILKSIGDIAAAESLIARIGAIADAVVAAGATGSMSAKLRRLTTDINALITRMGEVQDTPTANTVLDRLKDLLTGITLAELPDALTAAGNLKQSIEETAIAVPSDIQARYLLKTVRDIAVPANNTDYYLPETGNIDLSDFIHSTWFIYATTNKPDVIQLEVSMDGGTTWYKLEGYEITVESFVLDTWNQIDCPLMLVETRLLVSTGADAPGTISMAVVRKA